MEKELDLIGLCRYVWTKRRFVLLVTFSGFVLALIVALGIPREYSVNVKLLPRQLDNGKDDQNASVASMIGLSVSTSVVNNISIGLYPEIVKSTSFLGNLASLQVKSQTLPEMTLFSYITENQDEAWWAKVFRLPRKLFSSKNEEDEKEKQLQWDLLYLTSQQQDYVEMLRDKITIWEDKTSGLLNIEVLMQDPVVAAVLADTIVGEIQRALSAIRNKELLNDLQHIEKMYNEARDAYKTLVRQKDELSTNHMETEASLSLYNMIVRQYELLQVKVSDDRPFFSVIESARVPVNPAKPHRMMIVFVITFLSVFLSVVWVVLKRLFSKN